MSKGLANGIVELHNANCCTIRINGVRLFQSYDTIYALTYRRPDNGYRVTVRLPKISQTTTRKFHRYFLDGGTDYEIDAGQFECLVTVVRNGATLGEVDKAVRSILGARYPLGM